MKVEMTSYGATFNMRCPRCGNDEWSKEIFFVHRESDGYRKCLHCGADIKVTDRVKITIVVETPYNEFTPQTYSEIRKELETIPDWK